ncbi:4Fe-4S binding protein [Phreatobacter stygius]|uniref:4Fe-4S dicluster domain-containing protein n=1 Tax=Phreatobacter stygius TaxID=1940610 RepID=A0A4D7BAV8_9HYPH|nr:4Fe-4S binding protein [Phreatobacter stygius]QCI67905.1 4Fe-4S dicluster domain-containing protein [Phreatobacter stygius]
MQAGRTILVCSCEETMPLHGEAVAKACKAKVRSADQLCRKQLDLFKAVLGQASDVTVGCTQEAPLFEETAADLGFAGKLAFANVREQAGWSTQGADAGAKTAALLAAAAEEMPLIPVVTLESKGVALVYGRDETAIMVARRLADTLDVTVLLTRPGEVAPAATTEFPVVKGTISAAKGHLGAFDLVVDDYALPLPSSRRSYLWQAPRQDAVSTSDIVLDLTGGTALFPGGELRPGYLRADPADRAAVERLIGDARGLVGTFDKPKFITFHDDLCAHSRNRITGCTRCLDLCPTGAITPNGDAVAIDAAICAGCGACAAACPTGAAAYALPPVDGLMRRLRTLLTTYRAAGGSHGVVLLHDADHGQPLIDALARFGDGLPAHVMPLAVNEITQVGPELLAAAFAYGAAGVSLLGRARPKHDPAGLHQVLATANAMLAGLGYGRDLATLIETDDPDGLAAALGGASEATVAPQPSSFTPLGSKRGLLELSFRELHRAAPAPVDVVALAKGAPFGKAEVDPAACTLCHACVSACPTGALTDNPDQPMLRFTESLCVQCGLCEQTCPEDAITLKPQVDFVAWSEPRRVVKEEQPFHCTQCGKAFGTKSTIDRIAAKLEGHWMFSGDNAHRRAALFMCEDCRVEKVVNESFDPYGAPSRPRVRTAEDYLRELAEGRDKLN